MSKNIITELFATKEKVVELENIAENLDFISKLVTLNKKISFWKFGSSMVLVKLLVLYITSTVEDNQKEMLAHLRAFKDPEELKSSIYKR
jgi:hypothetical protein